MTDDPRKKMADVEAMLRAQSLSAAPQQRPRPRWYVELYDKFGRLVLKTSHASKVSRDIDVAAARDCGDIGTVKVLSAEGDLIAKY